MKGNVGGKPMKTKTAYEFLKGGQYPGDSQGIPKYHTNQYVNCGERTSHVNVYVYRVLMKSFSGGSLV